MKCFLENAYIFFIIIITKEFLRLSFFIKFYYLNNKHKSIKKQKTSQIVRFFSIKIANDFD